MTDDGFVFGEDVDDNETAGDETLFGTSSAESSETTKTGRRFGATDDTDAESFGQRVRAVVSDGTVRTAATVALAVGLVVALGLVGYPLVMGALDGDDSPSGEVAPTTDDVTSTGAAEPSPTGRTTTERRTETTLTATETVTPTTTTQTTSLSATPTPTERTTTAVPTRGFPAGEPADENETDDSG